MIFCIGSIVVSSLIQANILVDDFDSLNDLATRTVYVGSLTVTESAGRDFATATQVQATAWSPDSRYLAATVLDTTNYLAVYDNEALRVVAQISYPATFSPTLNALSWSSTSTVGASYIAAPFSAGSSGGVLFYKFNGNSLQLLPQATIISSSASNPGINLAWSPNGQYIAVSSELGAATDFAIYGFNGTATSFIGNDSTESTASPGSVSWSHEGQNIAFSDASGSVNIYFFDGSNFTLAGFPVDFYSNINGATSYAVSFHPTKSFIAYTYNEAGPLPVLSIHSYQSPINGFAMLPSVTSVAVSVDYPQSVAWSSDGAYIAVGSYKYEFYSFDDSSLTAIPGSTINPGLSGQGTITWSPDARYVALGVGSSWPTFNDITNSLVQLYSTGLNPTPSLAEAQAQAPSTLTNIVTSTADQFWGISGGDLKFSSTESAITRMRGRWEVASSQGSIANLSFAYLLNNSLDGNFYALDQTGKVHQATSVVVGPQARINWQVLSLTSGTSPVFVSLFQGLTSLMGIDENSVMYKYRPSSGWFSVGTSPV